jgi:hypothetical protein
MRQNRKYCKECDYYKIVGMLGRCIHESNIVERYNWYERYPIFHKPPDEINANNNCNLYHSSFGATGATLRPSLENLGY